MILNSPIKRRMSRKIFVGDVAVGGDAPISVQSMTNTETCDVAATVAQVNAIAEAGADIVRVSVPAHLQLPPGPTFVTSHIAATIAKLNQRGHIASCEVAFEGLAALVVLGATQAGITAGISHHRVPT